MLDGSYFKIFLLNDELIWEFSLPLWLLPQKPGVLFIHRIQAGTPLLLHSLIPIDAVWRLDLLYSILFPRWKRCFVGKLAEAWLKVKKVTMPSTMASWNGIWHKSVFELSCVCYGSLSKARLSGFLHLLGFLAKATRTNQSRARLLSLTRALLRRSRDDRSVFAGNGYQNDVS